VRFPVLVGSAALALAAAAFRSEAARGAGGDDPDARGGSGVAAAGQEPVRLELELEPRVRAGAPVRIRLRARNVTQRAADLYLRGRDLTFDVVVSRASGGVVWQRLEGETIPAIVQLRPLAPGEKLEVETVWDQRTNRGRAVGPGEYVVEGSLLLEGEPLRAAPKPLTIVRRGK
jgi:Intracellular proteinase inhibitor